MCREKLKTILASFIITVCCSLSGYAQPRQPVEVSAYMMPPYSLTLSDYSKIGSQQLVISIKVEDLNVSNFPVKLHIKMETAAGVSIETPPALVTLPVYLNGGATHILFGDDLKDYFNINSLIFKGYSKEDYRRNGQLPEGFYRFSIEALHYGTNRSISNRATVTAWIALGKPPILKVPDEGAELGKVQGMPLIFSWLPSNVGAPVGTLQYTFEMWEMRVPGIDPNVVAASIPVFHSRTLYGMTSLVVHPAELFLEQGMRYAWRVTAEDPAGQVPFAQKGRSLIRTFVYKAHCDTVTNFTVQRLGQEATFRWTPAPGHTSFNVEIEKPSTGWFNRLECFNNKISYADLDYGSSFRLRVQGVCNGNPEHVSDFSEWKTVTVPEKQVENTGCPECECKDPEPAPPITNFNLRYDLKPGDIINNASGKTRYIMKTVIPQGNGVYSGHFWLCMDIWNVKILCRYWDLSVNTGNTIVKMDFESVYDPRLLADVDALKAYTDSLTGAMNQLIGGGSDGNTPPKDTIALGFTIPENPVVNYNDSTGILTIIDGEGNPHEIRMDELPAAILDDAGNTYLVEKPDDSTATLTKTASAQSSEPVEEYMKNFYLLYGTRDLYGEVKYYYATLNENVNEQIQELLKQQASAFGLADHIEKGNFVIDNDRMYNVYISSLLHVRKSADNTNNYLVSGNYLEGGEWKLYQTDIAYSLDTLDRIKNGSVFPTNKLNEDLIIRPYAGKADDAKLRELFKLTVKWYDEFPYMVKIGNEILHNKQETNIEKGKTYRLEILNRNDSLPAAAKEFVFDSKKQKSNVYDLNLTSVDGGTRKVNIEIKNDGKETSSMEITLNLKESYTPGFRCDNCADQSDLDIKQKEAQRIIQSGTGKQAQGAAIYNELSEKEIVIHLETALGGDKNGESTWNKTSYREGLKVDFNRLQFNSNCITGESIVLLKVMDAVDKRSIKVLIQKKMITDSRVEEFKLSNPELFKQITAIIENPAIYKNDSLFGEAIDFIPFFSTNSNIELRYPVSEAEITEGYSISPVGAVSLYTNNLDNPERNFNYPARRSVLDPVPGKSQLDEYIQQNYTRTMIHELYHLWYRMKNPVSVTKWSLLREQITELKNSTKTEERTKGQNLENQLCDKHSSGTRTAGQCETCSEGSGHERHNSEGHGCCCIEFNY